jgi:hypothetical protein
MMPGNVTVGVRPAAGCLHGCAQAAGSTAPGLPDGRNLAIATLLSWLITEALGAYMLTSWIRSGGLRKQAASSDAGRPSADVPRSVILGHAGLAFTGFLCWVSFVAAGSAPLAWLSLGFLGPAIGLGISTVTVWTPYPGKRPAAPADRGGGWAGRAVPGWTAGSGPAATRPAASRSAAARLSDDALGRALDDEVLSHRLVDDMLASMLAPAEPASRRARWDLTPLIPAAHGVMAIATFLFAMLAAIAAIAAI